MIPHPQYDYNYGPHGPLASLHARAAHPDYPSIAPPYGWVWIVLSLHAELEEILPDYTIAQVKEKLAGLRFYIDTYGVGPDDPRVGMANDLIKEAEAKSRQTCQVCGAFGILRTERGWYATLCDDHV